MADSLLDALTGSPERPRPSIASAILDDMFEEEDVEGGGEGGGHAGHERRRLAAAAARQEERNQRASDARTASWLSRAKRGR